ncbi:transposase [Oerskovia turbata]
MLDARGKDFRDQVQIATLDPFHGYKNMIDDRLDDAVAVLDAFHFVRLANQAFDEVRRRVQAPSATEAGPVTRSTASATSCAPHPNDSPTGRSTD